MNVFMLLPSHGLSTNEDKLIVAWRHHMATEMWVNIGSGNGLLPEGNKPLPEPMLTDHQWSPVTFISGQFHNFWFGSWSAFYKILQQYIPISILMICTLWLFLPLLIRVIMRLPQCRYRESGEHLQMNPMSMLRNIMETKQSKIQQNNAYLQISHFRCTKSQNLNVSHLISSRPCLNLLMPCVKSRMKMQLEQCRQAMLQLHLNDQQFYCLLRCV